MRRIVLGFLAVLLVSPALADTKGDLIAADKAFAQMSREKGAHAAFLAYMADDVRLYDGDHPPIVGKQAAAEYYAAHPNSSDERLDWTPVEAEASPDGVLGYTRGTWVYTAKTPQGEIKVTGYYVTAWRRQADGRYKFTLDIGGADKPAAD